MFVLVITFVIAFEFTDMAGGILSKFLGWMIDFLMDWYDAQGEG